MDQQYLVILLIYHFAPLTNTILHSNTITYTVIHSTARVAAPMTAYATTLGGH